MFGHVNKRSAWDALPHRPGTIAVFVPTAARCPTAVGPRYATSKGGIHGLTGSHTDVVTMLATNGYITGQTINVNGGWYMR